MRAATKWSRRSVLGVCAAVAGIGGAGIAATIWMNGRNGEPRSASFPELLRRAVLDLRIPCNPAEAFLAADAGGAPERGIEGIVASIRTRLEAYGTSSSGASETKAALDTAGLVRLLARAIKDDFATGDLCLVEGWHLSMTECRLAALKLLWEREPQAGASVACRKEPLRAVAPGPKISKLVPGQTTVGVGFTVQPNGKSVINIYGADFQPGAKILMGEMTMAAAVGHSGWVNTYVPPELYSRARVVDVSVRNPDGTLSNAMQFEVVAPAAAPPPALSRIEPRGTSAGVPFAVQPNGESVINVYGSGFRSGAVILFDDVALDSSVGDAGWMNAYVPAEFYSRGSVLPVTVRNPDGTSSNMMMFEVASGND